MKIHGVDKTKELEVVELDIITDVYYITMSDKLPVFHTSFGSFYQLVTLDALEIAYYPYGFRRLDYTNLVNTNLIVAISSKLHRVFFPDGSYAYYSTKNYKHLRELKGFMELKARGNNMDI